MPALEQHQRLTQTQTLSPQMQQSLHVLQAPLLELRQLVRQELESNPVLEEVEPGSATSEEDSSPSVEDGAEEGDSHLHDEWTNYFSQSAGTNNYGSASEAQEKRQFFFDSLTQAPTLAEDLLEQARLNFSEKDLPLAQIIIGNLNDDGFLQAGTAEMSLIHHVPEEDIKRVLSMIQTLDPPGVGAADLRECLLLQLERRGRKDSLAYRIVDYCMDDLGRRRWPEIAKKLGVTTRDVQRAAAEIATLDPHPGRQFGRMPDQIVQPEVTVTKENGDWVVELNDSEIPKLRISDTYKDMVTEPSNNAEVRNYIRDKIRNGRFFIRSLQQRQQTILQIAREIVLRQRDFFEHGPGHLHPMTMNEVGEAVGVHETTVSRAVSGKYMQTPHGLFEMKHFFATGYESTSGERVSNSSVREFVAEIVAGEDPAKPLSDEEIAGILKKNGLSVARRTIAKYRDQLGILPSHLRKRL